MNPIQKYFLYELIHFRRNVIFNYKKWIYSFVSSFVGIALVFVIHHWASIISRLDLVMLVGCFGASAAIIFGTPHSPYALPRHVIGSHLISSLVGVSVYKLFGQPDYIWLCSALAVSGSILGMQATRTMHPPGGATALIAIIGTAKVHSLGYVYVLTPVLSGVLVLMSTSFLLKKIPFFHQLILNKHEHK